MKYMPLILANLEVGYGRLCRVAVGLGGLEDAQDV